MTKHNDIEKVGEHTQRYVVSICNDCYNLKGEMCNNPDCVFCRKTMAEVAEYLDVLMIRPFKIDKMARVCPQCNTRKGITEFKKDRMKRLGYTYVCKACDREKRSKYYYQHHRKELARIKRYYKDNKEKHYAKTLRYQERYPLKHGARLLLRKAVRSGEIVKQPCEVCGDTRNVHGHHDDYSKPLEVRWLCSMHHSQLHHTPKKDV